ncbi:MAG TPA: hypothetical protein VF834_01045 [Streptosporangiaceae bacterium]
MYFVQFPHPGGEHVPPGPAMTWNTGDHGRKFLLAAGQYVDQDDDVHHGEFVFWGEWEPPSQLITGWPTSGRLPRALHRPYWHRPAGSGWRQNTDPWVFGPRMLYSNCKQTIRPGNRPTALQRLTRGSVICFGSAIGGEFCADTILVVASAEPWTPADTTIGQRAGDAFAACTAGSLASGDGGYARTRLTLYRGATIDDPVDGMYSFVPALPADGRYPRFARPPIRLPGLINPASTQSAMGASRPRPAREVRDAWEAIRHQVLTAGLVLAVRLETPPQLPVDGDVPVTTRNRC